MHMPYYSVADWTLNDTVWWPWGSFFEDSTNCLFLEADCPLVNQETSNFMESMDH